MRTVIHDTTFAEVFLCRYFTLGFIPNARTILTPKLANERDDVYGRPWVTPVQAVARSFRLITRYLQIIVAASTG
jgi:hypothetical protein